MKRSILLTAALNLLFLWIYRVSAGESNVNDSNETAKRDDLCKSVEINRQHELTTLKNCRIIVGHLIFANLEFNADAVQRDEFVTQIEEITDFLLIYRTENLESLRYLLPKLKLLRGQELYQGRYSLIIYENREMNSMGLDSLLRLHRGQVRIENNPRLCLKRTIGWDTLLSNRTAQLVTLRNNMSPRFCPQVDYSRVANVKNSTMVNCAESETACSTKQYCLNIDKQGDCILCVNWLQNGKCVDSCNNSYYQLNKRECVDRSHCYKLGYIPHDDGVCLATCPKYHQRVRNADGHDICQLNCRGPYIVRTSTDLESLTNCTTINGSLTIELNQVHIQHKILDDLESAFRRVEAITGYLRVQRSPQLVSLNFFRRLQKIDGNELLDGRFVLYVVDNHHLEAIWGLNQTVALENGEIFFHLNPRLCQKIALELQPSLHSGRPITAINVSPNSNGERVVCNFVQTLKPSIEDRNATTVLMKLETLPFDYVDLVFAYVYHYREEQENISKYDGRHGCGHDNWHLDVSEGKNIRHIITNLKPDTRYAFFVRTIARIDYHIEFDAASDVQYFRTLPSQPGPVARAYYEHNLSGDLVIHWWPPRRPNGNITKYIINHELMDATQLFNNSQSDWIAIGDLGKICDCAEPQPESSGPAPDASNYFNRDLLTYEDELPNIIFVPRAELNDSSKAEKNATIFMERFAAYKADQELAAFRKQDTGITDFNIKKPRKICPSSDVSTQYQVVTQCQVLKSYNGTKVPGTLHSYTLHSLEAGRTYLVSLRACQDNICGEEALLFATAPVEEAVAALSELQKSNSIVDKAI